MNCFSHIIRTIHIKIVRHVGIITTSAISFVMAHLATNYILRSNSTSIGNIIVPAITAMLTALGHCRIARCVTKGVFLRTFSWAVAITCATGALWYILDPSIFDAEMLGFQIAASWQVFLFFEISILVPIGGAIGLLWRALIYVQHSATTHSAPKPLITNGTAAMASGVACGAAFPHQSNVGAIVLFVIGLLMCIIGATVQVRA